MGNAMMKTVVTGFTDAASAAACEGTAGVKAMSCKLGTSAATAKVMASIPDVSGQFLLTGFKADTKEYIEVWGSIVSPQVKFNGKKCMNC